jgi:glycosyltransferase involved in cell wall biosynthesis
VGRRRHDPGQFQLEPLGADRPGRPRRKALYLSRRHHDGPLTVLWVGSVILRKGIQYLVEAAKILKDSNIRFVVAGPILISKDAVAAAPPNMRFLGKVTRDRTDDLYREADVFVLPTISDGFAITQVEAMAKALPVITTPNCGEVVTDGVDGLIVPPFDGPALAAAIDKVDKDRNLLREMSHRAFVRSTQFFLPAQAEHLNQKVSEFRDNGYRVKSPAGGSMTPDPKSPQTLRL